MSQEKLRELSRELSLLGLPVLSIGFNDNSVLYSLRKGGANLTAEEGESVTVQDVLRNDVAIVASRRCNDVYRNTMTFIEHPLHHTPILFQGRPSLGFELEVVESVTHLYRGSVLAGFTLTPKASEYTSIQNMEGCLYRTASAVLGSLPRLPPNPRSTCPNIQETEEGGRVAMMMHADEPTKLATYADGNRERLVWDGNETLRELMADLSSPPQLERCQFASLLLPCPIYGCLELYARTSAVRLVYENIKAIPQDRFSAELYALLPTETQAVIEMLLLLRLCEERLSLLPIEVMHIIMLLLSPFAVIPRP